MSNLRWILLAGGIALLLVLLVVGLMRGRQTARGSEKRDLGRLGDPALGELPELGSGESSSRLATLPVVEPRAGTIDLPIIEMTATADEDASADTAALERPSIAEWPPAEQRVIVSLRILPAGQERLSGRRVRQSLQSAGFLHGELAIFHLPGRADRAMLSAANLSQPGQLDPAVMDYQRFAGLNVFTVLPGRVSPATALEQMYAITAELARRVDGRVLDDSGRGLDSAHVDDWLQRHLQQAPAPLNPGSAAAAG